MERVWAWLWARHGEHYLWAVLAVCLAITLPIWTFSAALVVRFEGSDRYLPAIGVSAVTLVVWLIANLQRSSTMWTAVHRWASGRPVDQLATLEATYRYARGLVVVAVVSASGCGSALGAFDAALAGSGTGARLQWVVAGFVSFAAIQVIAIHSLVEAILRPVRISLIADTDLGAALPRERPSLAAWANVATIATVWLFTFVGAVLGGALLGDGGRDVIVPVLIACAMTILFGVPITVGNAFAPMLRPIRDLRAATVRVAGGDHTQPVPVVQDDDLGVLAASFNRMQAGLAERQRLHAAFGSYVDPALAARLLEQGDDVFRGERRVVSVMFVDVRDFTPYAESHSAEETVQLLSSLFELIVPTVLDAGGHVNKYLGDGAMAVFGAPNELAHHADAALATAVEVQRLVADRFGGEVRIGIGINTGEVIAGTIGGGGKLEFTLIGDTVNVAARVEQLTKDTGDAVLITEATRVALSTPRPRSTKRGAFDLKGKSSSVTVHAVAAPQQP